MDKQLHEGQGSAQEHYLSASLSKINADLEKGGKPLIADATVLTKENFTVCLLNNGREGDELVAGIGFAKRNPTDRRSPKIGIKLALRRAVSDFVQFPKTRGRGYVMVATLDTAEDEQYLVKEID